MEHTINAYGHTNSAVHENMQSLIEQSGSVRKYAKDEIIYLQGDTAQSFCYIKKGSVKVYMNSVDGNEKTLNTARHGEIIGEGAFFDKKPRKPDHERLQSRQPETELCANRESHAYSFCYWWIGIHRIG